MKNYFLFFIVLFFQISCGDKLNTVMEVSNVDSKVIMNTPEFNADTAYNYIVKQLSFGHRIPGSIGQSKCAAWLESEFKKFADTVYIQRANVKQPISNKIYPAINIIASFNPNENNRILLLAHWDSRPWADQDTKDKDKPIMAADDGASGVAVLLEIASKLKLQKPNVGVDILLVDAEDVGRTDWTEESYCLGTQHWAKNPHIAGYRAKYGICLDMVGARGAQFPLEGFSMQYAPEIQQKVWNIGNRLGYSSFFNYNKSGFITDDHVVVNEIAKIPCIDIINLKSNGSFGDYWHTHQDDIQIIDKLSLKAVGHTVLQTIYEE